MLLSSTSLDLLRCTLLSAPGEEVCALAALSQKFVAAVFTGGQCVIHSRCRLFLLVC